MTKYNEEDIKSEEEFYTDYVEVDGDKPEKANPDHKPTQEPITSDELFEYLMYITTKEVKDEDHGKRIRTLAKRTTTLSDVAVMVRVLNQQNEKNILKLIEGFQIQERVLAKLGATEEMFKEVEEEYNKDMEEVTQDLFKQTKEASKEKKADGDGEEESDPDEKVQK